MRFCFWQNIKEEAGNLCKQRDKQKLDYEMVKYLHPLIISCPGSVIALTHFSDLFQDKILTSAEATPPEAQITLDFDWKRNQNATSFFPFNATQ